MIFTAEPGTHQFGVDPVETQLYILTSRKFKEAAASVDPRTADVRYRVERMGTSAVLRIVAEGETADDALRICRSLVKTALAVVDKIDAEAGEKELLANQREALERQKAEAEEALLLFIKDRNYAVADPAEQIAGLREQIRALEKERTRVVGSKRIARPDARIAKLHSKISDLVQDDLSYRRLKQSVEQIEQILRTVRERRAALDMKLLIEQNLQTLESCAPVGCREE